MGGENKIKTFFDLDAWEEGHKLVLEVYRLTRKFPKEEMFGLTMQMRRSAVSITSNIAEGFSRQSWREKVYFYSLAQGSVTELQNQLMISRDIQYINADEYSAVSDQAVKVHKINNGLIKASKKYISNV